MRFFDNGRNQFFPVDDIDRMCKSYPLPDGKSVSAKVYFKSDPERGIDVEDSTIDQILNSSQSLVPAGAGYRLLTFCFDPSIDEPPTYSDEPIIAWRMGIYGSIEPVVLDYEFKEMSSDHAVLEPDGRVHAIDAFYDTRQQWVLEMTDLAIARYRRSLELKK